MSQPSVSIIAHDPGSQAELASQPDAMADLALRWRELEQRCPQRSIFSSAEFLTLWYRHYRGVYGDPRVVLVEQRAAPLAGAVFVRRLTRFGGIPVRRLDLAGYEGASGELLVADGEDGVQGAKALAAVLAHWQDWDVAVIENIPPDAPWCEPLAETARRNGLRVAWQPSAFAYVDLRAGPEAHWAALEGKLRRNLKRALARGAAVGPMAVEGVRFFDPPTWPQREAVLERAFALTDAHPKMRAARRRMSDYHRGFYRALVEHHLPCGQFDLAILTIDGRDAAFVMALVERGVYYDVTVSYAEEFKSAFPGINLMYRLIASLPEHGVHTVISHGAHDYKRNWATGFREVLTLQLLRPNWRTRLGAIGRNMRTRWSTQNLQAEGSHA